MTIINADCLEWMSEQPDNSISCIITDPPYGLKFMSKKWDYELPSVELWEEALRICKPGAMMLCFGGTRTYHRLTCRIEDAGWEIRDCLMWLYAQGFPKSHNNFGLEGYGTALKPAYEIVICAQKPLSIEKNINAIQELFVLENATKKDGLNLCPNYEPIILAMKPLDGTFKQNAEKWGQAGINIDACRIEAEPWSRPSRPNIRGGNYCNSEEEKIPRNNDKGRWPANLILDEEAGKMLGEPARFFYCAKASASERNAGLEGFDNIKHVMYNETIQLTAEEAIVWQDMALKANIPWDSDIPQNMAIIDSYFGIKSPKLQELLYTMCICGRRPSGRFLKVLMYTTLMETSKTTASKIFNWLIKWSINESTQDAKQLMEFGLNPANCAENLSQLTEIIGIFQKKDGLCTVDAKNAISPKSWLIREQEKLEKELQEFSGGHPTVKPISLLEYLIKLIMPPKDGILLDPFAGSGTTILAAQNLGYQAIGIEKEAEYCDIAQARLKNGDKQMNFDI